MQLLSYICITFLIARATLANDLRGNWEVQSGDIQFHVHFPFKEVVGQSQRVKGKGICGTDQCEFLIAAPVRSFDSGDGNRDSHMQEVTKAALYPMTSVKITHKSPLSTGLQPLDMVVNFAGKTHKYEKVLVKIELTTGGLVKAQGKIPLFLSHFAVERPSLLGVAVGDNVEIEFNTLWRGFNKLKNETTGK